jgi:hypothetical protein
MYEFGARVLLAGVTILVAGTTGAIGFPLAVGVALALGLLAVAGYALDAQGLYDGAGAGFHAGLDGFCIALLLTEAGVAESLGFVALLPYVWAVARRRATWPAGAFSLAFSLVAAHALLKHSDPPVSLLLPAGGVLLLGLALALPKASDTPVAEAPIVYEDLELKGRFRALREAYSVLEQRSKDDGHVAALVRATTPQGVAQAIRNATGAAGAAIFVPTEDRWELFGSAGTVPAEVLTTLSFRSIQAQGATLLFDAGRPVGAIWTPEESRDGLASLSEVLAERFASRIEIESERKRRQEAEMRVTLVEGGGTPDAVAQALAASIGADSVEFGVVGPFGTTPIGLFGPPCGLPGAMRHESGTGLAGWIAAGTPIVWIGDARNDERMDGAAALRARATAMGLVPLSEGRAYVWAAWNNAGTGRPSALAAMRAAEPVVNRWLTQAVGR